MKTVNLSDKKHFNEVFDGDELVFDGRSVHIENCEFKNCRIVFDEEAANTIQSLAAFYKGAGQSKLLIEELFQAIRDGDMAIIRRMH